MNEDSGFSSADSAFNSDQFTRLARQTLESLESEKFRTVRRGYDPRLVEKRMLEAAGQIRSLLTAVEELSQRVDDLEAAAAQPPELDAKSLTAALGDEAVRVLEAARIAAEERVERAETERVEVLEEARSAATEIVQEGRTQGRHAVAEARDVRERILDDLAHKRRARRMEVEQLRAVRGKMLESLTSCRQLMDGLMTTLVDAMPHAAAAAERAGLRVASEPEPTAAQIESEIETARMAGLTMPSSMAAAGMSTSRALRGARHDVHEPDTPRDADVDATLASGTAESTGDTDGDGDTLEPSATGNGENDGGEALPEEVASESEPSSDGEHPLPERRSDVMESGVYDMEAETSEDFGDAGVIPGLTGVDWLDGGDKPTGVISGGVSGDDPRSAGG